MSPKLLLGLAASLLGVALLATTNRTDPRPSPSPSPSPSPITPHVESPRPEVARRESTPGPRVPDRPAVTLPAPAPATPPVGEAPPRTPTSWILPLQLGWTGAELGQPIHSPVAFRVPRCSDRDEAFRARVSDADGRRFAFTFPVNGLLPRAVANEQAVVVVGDEVMLARAAVLLGLPELAFPAQVELATPDGQVVTTLRLTEVAGAVCALPVR
jgi:hypothetical protein